MNVHLFGGASSPSCANFALKKTAIDNASHFDNQTIETVRQNFYVDDCLKSVGSEDEAVKLAKDLRDLFTFLFEGVDVNSRVPKIILSEGPRFRPDTHRKSTWCPMERVVRHVWVLCGC